MTTEAMTELRISNALKVAFAESMFMHQPDGRADQAITMLVDNIEGGYAEEDEEHKISVLAGGLAAVALIDLVTAEGIARDFYTNGLDYDTFEDDES